MTIDDTQPHFVRVGQVCLTTPVNMRFIHVRLIGIPNQLERSKTRFQKCSDISAVRSSMTNTAETAARQGLTWQSGQLVDVDVLGVLPVRAEPGGGDAVGLGGPVVGGGRQAAGVLRAAPAGAPGPDAG